MDTRMPQLLLRQLVPAEAIARNPPRFAMLMGKRSPYSFVDSDGSKVDFEAQVVLTELLART